MELLACVGVLAFTGRRVEGGGRSGLLGVDASVGRSTPGIERIDTQEESGFTLALGFAIGG